MSEGPYINGLYENQYSNILHEYMVVTISIIFTRFLFLVLVFTIVS